MVDEVRRLYWDQRHERDNDEQTHAPIPRTQGCTADHSSHRYTEDAPKTPNFSERAAPNAALVRPGPAARIFQDVRGPRTSA